MSKVNTTIRLYRPEDLNSLVRFWKETARLEATKDQITVRDLIDSFNRPNHHPEKNVFVAEGGGGITGYIDVISEPEIGRAVLQYLIHPEQRLKGITEKLVECAVERAEKLRAEKVQVNLPQDNEDGKRLFEKIGFRFVRRFLEMTLNLSIDRQSEVPSNDYPCRLMLEGEIEKLTKLQNRSFLNTWGFNPNTTEEIIYRIHLPNASFEDITFCFDGNEPIAYCWARIFEKEAATEGKTGRINMVGVDPDYRGKGLGKMVLVAGLTNLKSRGVRIVDLTVDGENYVARALYESLGFKRRTSSLWYQKNLDN